MACPYFMDLAAWEGSDAAFAPLPSKFSAAPHFEMRRYRHTNS
ncbi:hypothetical protein IMCC12053_648 [Celeribacter marinus]|uniref:Uncharacterized protein n=1 Tax=Celeribacter marinus TaxID=1397108 RepID=A0A0P0A9R8_9RHOB|nr:hypothetical protein IMCC12053_648 [Celeribacter marinus]